MRLCTVPILISVALSSLAPSQQNAPTAQRDSFVYKDSAYMMMLPEPISGSGVLALAASPQGDNAVFVRFPKLLTKRNIEAFAVGKQVSLQDASFAEIYSYNAASKNTTRLWSGNLEQGRMELSWLPGSGCAVATLSEMKFDGDQPKPTLRVGLINASGRSFRWLDLPAQNAEAWSQIIVGVSPTQSNAVVLFQQIEFKEEKAPDGKLMPVNLRRTFCNVAGPNGWAGQWEEMSRDFAPFGIAFNEKGDIAQIIGSPSWYPKGINLSKMQWIPAQEEGFTLERKPVYPMADQQQIAIPFANARISTSSVVITFPNPEKPKEMESKVVAIEGEQATLAQDLSSVFYVSRGVAYVREIAQIPKKVYEDALLAAERAKLLSQVKQVGMALMMMANDYDDTLPGANGFNLSSVDPYLRNNQLLNGFVYTFSGGNLTDLKDPAGTVLGYVEGPGGRAEVYADGHAKWVNNPKNP